ncbi:MAG: D-alanyl-D-alanine carboxypeptidase [Luteimonas sp.]|nr:D-alanyl-D-alanine carboxypeptidase [Luteimonas sp.]
MFVAALATAAIGFALAQDPPPQPAAPQPAPPAQALSDALPTPPPPAVTGTAWLLMDYASGQILAGENVDQRVEPASITKVLTSYVIAAEMKAGKVKPDDQVMMSENAWRKGGAGTDGSYSGFPVNQTAPLREMEKGMVVQSGNDAAIALAEHVAGSEDAFAALMNAYAQRIGMKNSHFVNSHGLSDPEHYSTPRDLALLGRAMVRDFPEEYAYNKIREFTVGPITQRNRNLLLWRDPSVDGIKTGHTQSAGYCLATSAKRDGMRLVSIVFGTASMRAREDASAALLNYGFTFFETVKVKGRGEKVLAPRLYKGAEEYVAIAPRSDVYVTVGRGDAALVRTRATAQEPLVAPASTGKALGEMTVSVGTESVARVPLYPVKDVPEGGWWTRMIDGVALMWR